METFTKRVIPGKRLPRKAKKRWRARWERWNSVFHFWTQEELDKLLDSPQHAKPVSHP